jgi:hypothetical protein
MSTPFKSNIWFQLRMNFQNYEEEVYQFEMNFMNLSKIFIFNNNQKNKTS